MLSDEPISQSKRKMQFEDIDAFFQSPPQIFFTWEMAVAFVLSTVLTTDTCATELIQQVEKEFPGYKLSDTVLYAALKFLQKEQVISGYWQKKAGRGRPRRMLTIEPSGVAIAQDFSLLWHQYMASKRVPLD